MVPLRKRLQSGLGQLIAAVGAVALIAAGQSTGPWTGYQGALLALSLPLSVVGMYLQLQAFRHRGRRFIVAALAMWTGTVVLCGWAIQRLLLKLGHDLAWASKLAPPELSASLGAFHDWTFFASIALILGGILYHPAVFRPEPQSDLQRRLLPLGAVIAALGATGIHGGLEMVVFNKTPDLSTLLMVVPSSTALLGLGLPILLCGLYLQARKSKLFGPSMAFGYVLIWVGASQMYVSGGVLAIFAGILRTTHFQRALFSLEVWGFSISSALLTAGIVVLRRNRTGASEPIPA